MITKNVREIDSRDTAGIHVRTLWDESQGKAFLEVVTDAGIATAEIPAGEVKRALHHPALYVDIPTKSLESAEINDRPPKDHRAAWIEALHRNFDSLDQPYFDQSCVPLEEDEEVEDTTLIRLGRILKQFDEDKINYVEFVNEAYRIYEDGIA